MATDTENSIAKKFKLSNLILVLGMSVLLCTAGYCGYKLDSLSKQQEQLKEDYSTINSITFGIFSIDQWRDKILAIVNGQVQDFKMTREQRKALQAQVEAKLRSLVNKTVAEINKPQKTFAGKLKKLAFNSVVNVDDIQAQVPGFAKTIITKINSPASTRRLKNIATSKLNQLEKQTYDSTEEASLTVKKYMFNKYKVDNSTAFNESLGRQLDDIRKVTYNYAWGMFGCMVIALGLWWFLRKHIHLQTALFILSLLFAFLLLVVGITASIIEVDARIGTLSFELLGQKILFENQVLFFQSKSILQIIQVLVSQPKPDAVAVGVILALFVVVLPVIILIATGLHVAGGEKISENRVVKYLAFESGKWNMADVMVVGILMTYIGLNGILKSQLSNLNLNSESIKTITTNNTSLQPGYLIFVGYVVYETILSKILKVTYNNRKTTQATEHTKAA